MLSGITDSTTIPQAGRIAAAADPDATFVITDGMRYTYGQIDHEAARVATGLRAHGVAVGDRVALAANNRVEWIVSWLAITRLGAIVVTLNVAYREREFTHMLNQSGARVLLCVERDSGFEFRPFIEAIRAQVPDVETVLFMADPPALDGDPLAPPAPDSWVTLRDATPLTEVSASIDEPAMILYTSGTTGLPKGAVLTHRSLMSSARAQAEHLGFSDKDVAIGQMPLTHVGGTTCTVLSSLICAGQVVLIPKFSPAIAVEAIADLGLTVFIGVPTMYALTMAHADFSGVDTTNVRVCIIGGSNVEPALGERVLASFPNARLANLYGLSETSGGCIISAAEDQLADLTTTIGVAIGDYELAIDTADLDEPSGPDMEGELLVRGDCVAAGYWQNPEASTETFLAGGWLRTGDMAQIRADGRVVLRGRKKEMYVRGGYNVYPAEVENVIAQDPAVAGCAVVGVPDELHGEIGVAFVVPTSVGSVTADSIVARCREQLAAYKVPSRIQIVDALPLTPSGKVRKPELQQLARSRGGA